MNCHYQDILSRIADPPLWFDENAVPRFVPFTPDHCANIYANECALLRIACQSCRRQFVVCVSYGSMDVIRSVPPLTEQIRAKSIGYGDPPNVECCPAGPTMSSDTVRVLEYWHRPEFDWARDITFEVEIDGDP